jgi:N-alpha-acetyltransferase 38, NatC auxiliary subunit
MTAQVAPVERLKSLMGYTWRISIQDKRIFLGTLVCTDKDKNIILTNADEMRRGEPNGRYVGMIMIPWRWVVKAEVEWTAYMENEEGNGENPIYT